MARNSAFDPSKMLHNPLFNESRYRSAQVCEIANINGKMLEHLANPGRSPIDLSVHHTPKIKGKPRFFTGGDVYKIVALYVATPLGFPQRWAYLLTDMVAVRARNKLAGVPDKEGVVFAAYPIQDGKDWAHITLYKGQSEPPPLPVGVILIDVDRLIDETTAKLVAADRGEPLPDFSVPDPKADPDFMLIFTKDAEGRKVYVGLTFEESKEYAAAMSDHLSDNYDPASSDRFLELFDKHEAARMIRIHEESEKARNAEKETPGLLKQAWRIPSTIFQRVKPKGGSR